MIGIFDSGSGGLTVLKEIRKRLPKADILYFGDIKNAPYGSKTKDELVALTAGAIELLQKRGAKKIVSACNSVSAALVVSSNQTRVLAPENLIEMIEPTASYFKDSVDRILLTATPATINSGIYQNAFEAIGKEIETVAIPDLAGAIEFGATDAEVEQIIREAFAAVDTSAFDTLILGCTHYPLVKDVFEKVMPTIKIVDPALAVASRVAERMGASEVGADTTTFLISKESESFRDRVAQLWPGAAYTIEVI
ncbi:MAG: glutamate racemase [Candidatus Paceibacterota bacterium]